MDFQEHILPVLKEYRPFIFIILAIVLVRKIVITGYRRRKKLKRKDNFIIGINNVTVMLVGFWLFFLLLHILGITIQEFFTSITIFAAALAIVFRDYILNGLNGMLLMFGDNYRIGDYIEVDGVKGQIEDLTLLNVHVKNDEDNMVIMPNNLLATSRVVNYSQNPRHFSSMDFEMRTAVSLTYEALDAAMKSVLSQFEEALRPESFALQVREYSDDIVHYRLRFGLKKYDHTLAKEIKQQLYRKLLVLIEQNKNIRT
jgi:small-conductance mechanosensitive channel